MRKRIIPIVSSFYYQISKAFTTEWELKEGFLKRGNKVLVVIKRHIEEDASKDEGNTEERSSSGRVDEAKATGRQAWDEIEATSESRSLSAATAAAQTSGNDRLTFVVSSRPLEADPGLIKRSLKEYNQR